MKALISEDDAKALDERLQRAIDSSLDQEEAHVVRMRYGIGISSNTPLSVKPGLLHNRGVAATLGHMERFLIQYGKELRGATPQDATKAFFGHGAHLGDDAEGEALRLATSGPPH